jgi:glycosyltransferase involved in cell wall biosynthesis
LRRVREAPRYALVGRALRRAAHVLTTSRWMQASLAAGGVESHPLALPVAGVNGFRRRRAADPVFVYGGRLDPEKGVEGLLRSFGRLRDHHPRARLRVYGDGGNRERLAELARPQRAAVAFVPGMCEDWWQQAADAWAVVVPSVWDEPFGLVAAEAIIRGIPVIASDCGGLRETVVDGRTGLLYPRGNERALADRLMSVATGRALAGDLPPGDVQELSERHDPDLHFGRLHELFETACAA